MLCTRHIDIPAQAFAIERGVSRCLLREDGREISYASAGDAGTTDSSPRLSEDFPLERHARIPVSVVFSFVIPSFLHILLVGIAGYSMFVMILTWLSCTSTEQEIEDKRKIRTNIGNIRENGGNMNASEVTNDLQNVFIM